MQPSPRGLSCALRTLLVGGALLAVSAGMLSAQQRAGRPAMPPQDDPHAALEQFQAEYGPELEVTWNFDTGYPELIFGKPMSLGFVPETDIEYVAAARNLIDSHRELFGLDSAQLLTRQVKRVSLERIGSSDKVGVEFTQEVEGMPVEYGTLVVLFNTTGDVLAVDNQALPNAADLRLDPRVPERLAEDLARRTFGHEPAELHHAEILIVLNEDESGPALAWNIELHAPAGEDGVPRQELITVDADNGRILRRRPTVHTFTDLFGTVQHWASPGTRPDKSSNAEVLVPVPNGQVTSPVGNTVGDTNGNWTIPYGGASDQDCSVNYGSGNNWVWVRNETGGQINRTKTATPGVSRTLTLNVRRNQKRTAQTNAKEWVERFRLWIKGIDPTDTLMDFRVRTNVNIAASCNAFFDGSSINHFLAGGGCVNTAYSTVILHEEGHFANNIYGSFNGSDGFGEGNSDAWAMYIADTHIVGEEFCGSGCHIRLGTNTLQYCGTCSAGCHGGVHNNGRVHMGALWKVRRNLNTTYGDAAGDLVADTIFLTWMQVFNSRKICVGVRNRWLIVDDDDGDIDNGTPNGTDIDDGFAEQGYPNRY